MAEFLMHQCSGPITRELTENGYHYQWRTCTECGEESLAGRVNLAALAKLDFSKEESNG